MNMGKGMQTHYLVIIGGHIAAGCLGKKGNCVYTIVRGQLSTARSQAIKQLSNKAIGMFLIALQPNTKKWVNKKTVQHP